MINIGCHLSVSEGYGKMGEKMVSFGGDTFSWFTRNPRGGKAKDVDPEDIDTLLRIAEDNSFGKLVAHGSYTMNLCSAKPDIRAYSIEMLRQDLERMELLPGNYYNFHPGSHTGLGAEAGIELIAEGLDQVLFPEMNTIVLLETMAGKGTEIGRSFEEICRIIEKVELKDKLGVCFDTCHVWDAGYDIVNDLSGVLEEFDNIIGLDRLKAIHLNDSKNICGSHKDRHEKLGMGELGYEALKRIVLEPAFAGIPFILETPNDDKGYIREIAIVKEWIKEP